MKLKINFSTIMLIIIFFTGSLLIFLNTSKIFQKKIKSLEVLVSGSDNSLKKVDFPFSLNPGNIRKFVTRIQSESGTPRKLIFKGILLIEEKRNYEFNLNANNSASIMIDGMVVLRSSIYKLQNVKSSPIKLTPGKHLITINFTPSENECYLFIRWRQPGISDWMPLQSASIFSPSAISIPAEKLKTIKNRIQLKNYLKNLGIILLILLFISLIVKVIFIISNTNASGNSFIRIGRNQSGNFSESIRFREVDLTKGFAGFLMIAAHIDGGRFFYFGTFGAALFFLCSGINTMIFSVRNYDKKNFTLYSLFFSILLFFGGYTQIVIAHGTKTGLIPEFLQISALSIIIISILIKILKKPALTAYLFLLPFFIYIIFRSSLSFYGKGIFRFFWGRGFTLLPWVGYFLFGLFLFLFRKNKKILYLTILSNTALFIVSFFILNIPIVKFKMTLSYIAASLLFLTLIFYVFSYINSKITNMKLNFIRKSLELTGRNSLLFVYLHYAGIYFFKPKSLETYYPVNLLFQSVVIFLILTIVIFTYEKIKYKKDIIYPLAGIALILILLRISDLLYIKIDLKLIDIYIGIIFAVFYVFLRKKLRTILKI